MSGFAAVSFASFFSGGPPTAMVNDRHRQESAIRVRMGDPLATRRLGELTTGGARPIVEGRKGTSIDLLQAAADLPRCRLRIEPANHFFRSSSGFASRLRASNSS